MKTIIHIVAVLLISLLLQAFLPWWTMAIGAFATGLFFRQSGFKSFVAGLFGVGILWFVMAWYLDSSTDSILSSRVAAIFPTKTVGLLMLITAIIGGLVGGFASMTGGLMVYKKKSKY